MADVLKGINLRWISCPLFIQVMLCRILAAIEVCKGWYFEHLLEVDVDIIVLSYDVLEVSCFLLGVTRCLIDSRRLALLARIHLPIEIYNNV